MNFQIVSYSLGGTVPQRYSSGHISLVPYGTFHTRTGPILLAASNDRLFARLWSVLDAGRGEEAPWPALAERVANRDVLNACLAVLAAEWERDALEEQGDPSAPVQTLPELLEDQSLASAGVVDPMVLPDVSDLLLPGPIFGGDLPRRPRSVAPRLGEHTGAVLREFGLTSEVIDQMAAEGALLVI